jgi:hypothetical protein
VPFASNRSELFAELLAQVILCQVAGNSTCSVTELSYAGETLELSPEATAEVSKLYEAGLPPKELVSRINRVVETLVVQPPPESEFDF